MYSGWEMVEQIPAIIKALEAIKRSGSIMGTMLTYSSNKNISAFLNNLFEIVSIALDRN